MGGVDAVDLSQEAVTRNGEGRDILGSSMEGLREGVVRWVWGFWWSGKAEGRAREGAPHQAELDAELRAVVGLGR